MSSLHSSILVLAALLIAVLAVATIQGTSEQFLGRCLGKEEAEHFSPDEMHAIGVIQRRCPSMSSTIQTYFVAQRNGNVTQELFSIPAFMQIDDRTMRTTTVVVHWKSEKQVLLLVPELLLSEILEQLEPHSPTLENEFNLDTVRVSLVPVRPNHGFNRTPVSSGPAKPGELSGGAG